MDTCSGLLLMRLRAQLPYINQGTTYRHVTIRVKLVLTERAIRHAFAFISRQEMKKCWYEKLFDFFSLQRIYLTSIKIKIRLEDWWGLTKRTETGYIFFLKKKERSKQKVLAERRRCVDFCSFKFPSWQFLCCQETEKDWKFSIAANLELLRKKQIFT